MVKMPRKNLVNHIESQQVNLGKQISEISRELSKLSEELLTLEHPENIEEETILGYLK
jgi:hypothetical protein